jgi:protein tyrosine/serine phosphatase
MNNTQPEKLPSPPFVNVDGVKNFRDLGGYAIRGRNNVTVRRGVIYRSAHPSRITPDGISTLNGLGVKTIFDLRSVPEIERHREAAPVADIAGTTRVHAPVYKKEDYSPETHANRYQDEASKDGSAGFVKAYTEILENAGESYGTMFRHMLDKPGEPFLLHCALGKDRTGVFAALVLRLAGVPDDTIAKEFALTEPGLGEWKDEILSKLMKDPNSQNKRDELERMLSAKREDMLAVLKALDETFGCAEDYATKHCGLSAEETGRLKRHLVIEEGTPIML